jgi:hypothetical protein
MIPIFWNKKIPYLHPEAADLEEEICPSYLGRQHARRPGIRQWFTFPPIGGRQRLNPLAGLKHGLRGQVVLGHQVN